MKLPFCSLALLVCVGSLAVACGDSDGGDDVAESGESEAGTSGGGVEGIELIERLGGLWAAPVSMTPLGSFPIMNMDLRPASDHVLFSRVDLDSANSLRFAFSVETHDGRDVVVYRNGGLFGGASRDSRTELIEHDAEADSWRFCAIEGGCDYVDALWDFDGADELLLDVKVRGSQHVWWPAHRDEPRTLPDPFPVDPSSQGTGEAPFPPMPTFDASVSWDMPVDGPADVWLMLSTTPCGFTGDCTLSRFIRTTVDAGTSEAELHVDQVHGGDYHATVVIDRNQNLGTILFPDTGDAISLPMDVDVTIAPEGASSRSFSMFVDVP